MPKLPQEGFDEFVFVVSSIIQIKFGMECNSFEQAEFYTQKYLSQIKEVFDADCFGKNLTLQEAWCKHIGPELNKIMAVKV